jgi:hypothetical protein
MIPLREFILIAFPYICGFPSATSLDTMNTEGDTNMQMDAGSNKRSGGMHKETKMTADLSKMDKKAQNVQVRVQGGPDTVYSIGLFGAWYYFISNATTPEERIKGFFKGFIWPALLVLALFRFLEKD